jgi:hypothetical protein
MLATNRNGAQSGHNWPVKRQTFLGAPGASATRAGRSPPDDELLRSNF